MIAGYEPDSVAVQHFKIVEGRPLSGNRQIIIGKQAAANLKAEVGDTLNLFDQPYRIVGIYETGLSFEEAGGVITLDDAQAIFKKPHQVSFFEVQLRDPDEMEVVKQRIERFFPDYAVSLASDFGETQVQVQSVRGMAYGIGLIAVLVGGLGMMNTMIMVVYEQTREIGVLRAVGWSKGRVLRMVLGQALALSFLGGLGGLGLGYLLVVWANATPAVSSFATGIITPSMLIEGMVMALILGTVGGMYPAWRAAGLQPTEALNYEGGAVRGRDPGWTRIGGMALRNLWRRRGRSLLTLTGIAIGVGLIVSLGAMTEGTIRSFTAMNASTGAELMAMQAGVADMSFSAIDERIGRAIEAMPEVEEVSGLIFGVASTPDIPFVLVWGVEPTARVLAHYRIVEGRPISGRGEVMLGFTTAENLHKGPGDILSVAGGTYRVTGVYQTGIAYEEGAAVMALRDAQIAFKKPRQVGFYQIKLKNPEQAEAVRQKIEDRFGEEISVSLAAKFVENTNDIQNFKAMLGAIFFMAILVGGVVVTNTMVMTVLERTREIGTLRALGWRQSRVLGMILGESLTLSAISGLAGIVLGIALGWLLSSIPAMNGVLEMAYPPNVLLQGYGVALLLGGVGGLYPAWRAGRLRPIEALRYE
ncbi:MAG: ABC transporter permease [Caldilineae bacterium]|nr:MAG: ABC transporter permease [Caldilineae bacterium]